MNKEGKITICVLTLMIIGFIVTKIDAQHKHLEDTINKSELRLDSVVNEYQNLNLHYDSLINIIDSLPLGSPLDTLKISSEYGWRRRPLRIGWQMHAGTDYLAAWQDTVYATGNGIVKRSRWNAGYGRCIIIDHVWGYQSTYAHLYRYFVRRGDTVHKGQPIARAGNSGAVTGPHLHYEVRRYGKTTNPSAFMLDN
jgi:murein DD-endopeptidase MepM/ murein hydrolase activator NlpD|tara:strand:+ start:2823 stop:3410 length:588 start_codon:yes stop_codon:yes gene_type:complete